VTQRALTALIAFFVLVAIYISFRFEPKMAVAAFIAMIHDLLVTIGVYSLFGFQVTPDTVIAILTISATRSTTPWWSSTACATTRRVWARRADDLLRDDQPVDEPDAGPVHQHLAGRHPPGARRAGGRRRAARATTLQDYGLALFVGLLSGAYSSIFIAARCSPS